MIFPPHPVYGAWGPNPVCWAGVWLPGNEEPSAFCHCERSEAILWPSRGLLLRLWRLGMTGMRSGEEITFVLKFPEGKIHPLDAPKIEFSEADV